MLSFLSTELRRQLFLGIPPLVIGIFNLVLKNSLVLLFILLCVQAICL